MKHSLFNIKSLLAIGFGVLLTQSVLGQAVSINSSGTAPHTQSILDISSTTKGVLLPRMTTGDRTSFVPTTTGMTVYDITTQSYWYWDDTANIWKELASGGIQSATAGDGLVNSGTATAIIFDVAANNGLNVDVPNDMVQLGGALTENTLIPQGNFTLDFTTTATDGFSIDGETFSVDGAGDKVGIGTDAPSGKLQVTVDNAGLNVPLILRNENGLPNNGANSIGLGFAVEDNGDYVKSAIIHERTGDFGIGSLKFLVSDIASSANATTADTKMTIFNNGNVTITGKFNSNGIQETSDKRFKKDIEPLTGALKNLLDLDGVTYKWRSEEFPEKHFTDRTEIGLIAQELEAVYPELVATDADGYKSVQYSHLVPVLIEAIKEQQKTIANLDKTVELLNAQASKTQSLYETLNKQMSAIYSELQLTPDNSEVSSK
ncbi:MAG: tail fiber domain-containing protein [Flavobacteriales bacterium]